MEHLADEGEKLHSRVLAAQQGRQIIDLAVRPNRRLDLLEWSRHGRMWADFNKEIQV